MKKNIEKLKLGKYNFVVNHDKKVVTCVADVRGYKGIGMAYCSPEDEFDSNFGMALSKLRAIENAYEQYETECYPIGIAEAIIARKTTINTYMRMNEYDERLLRNWRSIKDEINTLINSTK